MDRFGPRSHPAVPRCHGRCVPRDCMHGSGMDGEWKLTAASEDTASGWDAIWLQFRAGSRWMGTFFVVSMLD